MIDQNFYQNRGPFSLKDLAAYGQAELHNCTDPEQLIFDVSALHQASSNDIACLHNVKYIDHLKETQAGAIIIHPDQLNHAPCLPLLVTPRPYRTWGKIAHLFYPDDQDEGSIHPTAQISTTARIGLNCKIGPFAVIEDDVVIGDDSVIDSHTFIGKGVKIGTSARIASHVTIQYALIGDHVVIKTGARIGQKGFGFEMDEKGHFDIPQLGRVLIGHNVEVGANTTIDRGSSLDTIIGDGTRIDNLVQIAHNVQIGKNCVIVAQVGISGSTKLGNFVIAAGQVGITGHLTIGDGAKIGAQSGVMRDVEAGDVVAGSPAVKAIDWKRQVIALQKMIKTRGKG
jgi:UDP-3-O-[3-hydroxymyristoyl] glucosamine N-acyltransferase